MSEVHGEGNVIVYSDVCLRYRVRNVIVYSDGCLSYRLRELLLCTVMCV